MISKRLAWTLTLLAGLFVFLMPALYGSAIASSGAVQARTALKAVPVYMEAGELALAEAELEKAEKGVKEIGRGLKALGAWRYAPWLGSRLQSLETLGQVGSSAIAGGRTLVSVAKEMKEALDTASIEEGIIQKNRSYQDLTKAERIAIMRKLSALLPKLKIAREQIAIAAQAWESIPQDELLLPLRNAITPHAEKLIKADKALTQAINLLEWMVPLTGTQEKATYLVLLQNSDELRPTGGFIGTIGVITVDAGHLESFEFEDVYSLDRQVEGRWNEPQPHGLAGQFGNKIWYLRDANWSPDVPTSAGTIKDFYLRESSIARGKAPRIDGIIFTTPELFKRFIGITGPITVEGRVFNQENFFDKLQYDVEQGFLYEGTPDAQRKDIVKQVGNELIRRLMRLPASQWPELLASVTDSFKEQDLAIVVEKPEVQRLLDTKQWSGRVLAPTGDFLWIVDANVNAQKTDGVMDKHVTYQIEPEGDRLKATVTLRYYNSAQKVDWRYTHYRSYTRVYVPEQSELISANGCVADVYYDLGKRVFGCHWKVGIQQTQAISFSYYLPPSIQEQVEAGTYTLTAQKQAGAKRELTLDLSFGKKLQNAVPAEERIEWGDKTYHFVTPWESTLTTTLTF